MNAYLSSALRTTGHLCPQVRGEWALPIPSGGWTDRKHAVEGFTQLPNVRKD
jgi:hypothetical protein